MSTMKNIFTKPLLFIFLISLFLISCGSDDNSPIIPDPEIAIDDAEEETEETPTDDSTDDDDDDDTEDDDSTTTEDDDSTTTEDDDSTTTEDDDTTTDGDDDSTDTTEDDTDTDSSSCEDPASFIFNENDGLVVVEFENAVINEDWALENSNNGFTGDGYLVWNGNQYFNNPGNGTMTFKINIETTGTYQFMWHSAITIGNNGTEHNDTWLRFDDADDFYGEKVNGDGVVYPSGRGKSPNPQGSSSDGWFKIFRSGGVEYKWQALTSDNNAHEIFVRFDQPGVYLMEVSARSSGHAIDKFVLFNNNWSAADATSSSELSVISCN